MNSYLHLSIGISLLNILLGIFVYLSGKRKLANIIFSFFALFSALWILSIYLALRSDMSLFFGRLSFTSSIISFNFLALFIIIFPDANKDKLKTILPATLISLAIFFSCASLTDLMVRDVAIINNHLEGTFGPIFNYYKYYSIFFIITMIFILTSKFRQHKNLNRLKIKYIFLGIGLFIIPSLFTNMVLPAFLDNYNYNHLGPLFSIFMVGFISYATVKHQLLSVSIIIQRSLIYSGLLGIIIIFYLGLLFFIGNILQKAANATIFLSAGLTTIFGIFSVSTIERYFKKWTDSVFFKDRYDYPSAINLLSQTLNTSNDFSAIIFKTSENLKSFIRSEGVIFLFWQQKKIFLNGRQEKSIPLEAFHYLRDYQQMEIIAAPKTSTIKLLGLKNCYLENNWLIAPVNLGGKKIASLLLTAPLSGNGFLSDDLKLIKNFTLQAAVSLEKARLLEKERNYAKELEKKVEQRTAKIKELQKEQQKMMLEVSHELQTPLTIIKIGLEKLKQDQPDGLDIKSFEKSIDWISKYTYDLLRLARMKLAENFKREELNLSKLFEDLTEYYDVMAKGQGIRLEYTIEPEVLVFADKAKIEELANILMSNAIKYIANEKKISLRLSKQKNRIEISLCDSGIGIKKENLKNIFKQFFMEKRIDGPKGSGLGLAMAKKIVETHNGTISVESTEEQGSCFIVELPVIKNPR